MDDERMRVLRMVEEGKVTPQEGARLLDAIRKTQHERSETAGTTAARCLRITVTEAGRQKVNVAIPLSLARLALRWMPPSVLGHMEMRGIKLQDLNQLVEGVEGAGPFKVVEVEDGDEKVEIAVE